MSEINCDSSIRIVFKTVTLSHPDSDIFFKFFLFCKSLGIYNRYAQDIQ